MHRLSDRVCLLACCQKHESIRVLLQVAIILYLLILMGQLCHDHALSLAKEAFFTQGGSGLIRSSGGYFGTPCDTMRIQLNRIIIVPRNNVEMVHMWYASLLSSNSH